MGRADSGARDPRSRARRPHRRSGGELSARATIAAALERAPLPEASARERLVAALGPLSVVDLETTGLDPDRAAIVEVGVVTLRGDSEPRLLQRLVAPGAPLPALTRQLTGLSDADFARAPSWEEVRSSVAEAIRGTSVVAHNAAFERAFLGDVAGPGATFLDTLELACVLHPELSSHGLAALAELWLGRRESHRALDDALDTLALLARFQEEIAAGEHRLLAERIEDGADLWDWAPLFRRTPRLRGRLAMRPGSPGSRGRARVSRRDARLARVGDLLGDESAWRRVVPGYRMRRGQVELGAALADAFRHGGAIAVEAGTGIGKTLAYCLVAVLHFLEKGERVFITSANRTLQERVFGEELAHVAAFLDIDPPPAVVLKGRANYGSPRRAHEVVSRPAESGFGDLSAAARLYTASFFARCPDRDLDAFGGWMLRRDGGLFALRDRLACSAQCDEVACRAAAGGPCAYLRHVDALAEAALVSINHSLLLRWPARYGEIENLIVDEAHELVAEGDRAFTEELASRDVLGWLRRLVGGRDGGLLGAVGRAAGEEAAARALAGIVERAEERVLGLGRALQQAAGERSVAVPGSERREALPGWVAAEAAAASLARTLAEIGSGLEMLAASCRRAGRGSGQGLAAEAATIAQAALAASRGLLADAFAQSEPDTVYAARGWRGRQGEAGWALRATPLDVAPRIHARALERPRVVAAVSATLGIGGDPGPTLEKLGWDLLPEGRRLPSRVLASPFDYRSNAVLAFVRVGDYRSPAFVDGCAEAVASIARLLGGRTMALFTNTKRLAAVADRLETLLAADSIPAIVQRRGPGAGRLVTQFREDSRAVLLGTRSLWQGVDIPGQALSCVVIDKLPFPVPGDPLLEGRRRRILAAGGDAFRSLSLEPAVVAFKQMFGRLIRSESDRGFVVILGADASKPYVGDFVASLPGPPRVFHGSVEGLLDEMRAFFRLDRDGASLL